MATTTIVGNLTADPELRYTQNGVPVVNLTVAETPRIFDRQTNEWKDGETSFFRCRAWRTHAENIAASFRKGQRVIVTGEIRQRSYQDREGNTRSTFEMDLDEIGPSVRYGTATFTRAAKDTSPQQSGQTDAWTPQGAPEPHAGFPPAAGSVEQPDAWAAAGTFGDDTPF